MARAKKTKAEKTKPGAPQASAPAMLKVEQWPIERVQPYPGNPRKIGDASVRKVAASIQEFGFRQPIVVDADGVVIVGHTRLLASKSLGFTHVPVSVAADLTEEQVRAYRLADNRTNEESAWDEAKLIEELLALQGSAFDLLLTGFDDRELQDLLTSGDELDRADRAPPAPENPASVLGDVWLLGRHRLVCGDSTSATDVSKALNGAKPRLMATDPPYGVEYDPSWRKDAGVGGEGVATGKVLNDDRADWREVWALFPGDVAYVWHGGLHGSVVADSLIACRFEVRAQIIWVKQRPAMSRGHYHWQHEPAFYVVKEGAHAPLNFEEDHEAALYAVKAGKTADWHGNRRQSTVWTIEHLKNDTGHGTQKPVECMRRPILNNSEPGGGVFEPFSGSGTTLIAAEMTGRTCYALELNPVYVDVGVLRWQEYTGHKATLEGDGRTFDEVMAARGAKPPKKPKAAKAKAGKVKEPA